MVASLIRTRRPGAGWLLPPVLLFLVFAGCVESSAEKEAASAKSLAAAKRVLPDSSWAELALPFGERHDHADPLHHQDLSTPNFEILGYNPLLSPDYGTTAFGYLCGDAQTTQDGRRLAVVESRSDVAFALADVTDPHKPQWLGELVMRRTYVYDLAVVPDGRHVVLVTTDLAQPDPRSEGRSDSFEGVEWRSACTGWQPVPLAWEAEDPVPRPFSLLLVSIANPAQPTIIDQRPLLGFGHGVSSTRIDGRTWVVAATYAQNSGLSNYQFYEILATPGGARLQHLSTFVPATVMGDPTEWGRGLGHVDGWITKHPKTGQTLAWLAHWNSGVLILDLANPQAPRLVGRWTDYDPSKRPGDSGQTHSIYPLPVMWGDRHYTVAGPELVARPPSTPSGLVWVLDTTDPAQPRAVGVWTLSHDVQWSGRLMFSTHYLSVHNRTALVSMYHAGVWAIDLSGVGKGEALVQLPSVGVFIPAIPSPKPPRTPMRWAPTLEEVLGFGDGTFVTFDSNSGLYTFRFDDTNPMPAPLPWPSLPTASTSN